MGVVRLVPGGRAAFTYNMLIHLTNQRGMDSLMARRWILIKTTLGTLVLDLSNGGKETEEHLGC